MSSDVIIVGAGVIGSAIARELSRKKLKILVLEKELDVAFGNSSRNTGMLHAGFTYKPGSLKARLCVEGNREFDEVAKELGVSFRRTGKVVIGFNDDDLERILKFKAIGEENGVEGLEIVDKTRLNEIAPGAGGNFAMHCPTSGILDPIGYTIALAENAAMNGVEFRFGEKVTGIERNDGMYEVTTDKGLHVGRWIINAAGMNACVISDMLGFKRDYIVKGFKGEYIVLDKNLGKHLNIPVYPAPDEKGGFSTHATPTIDGNVLVGPDSYISEDLEDYETTKLHLDGLYEDGKRMFPYMDRQSYIRSFAGIRVKRVNPMTNENLDFLIEDDSEIPNAVNLVGIESPGLTCSLPIARRVVSIIEKSEKLEENPCFNPVRHETERFNDASDEERARLIEMDPDYGEIICRCEKVTRKEILEAIRNPLGAATVASVKNRTRAGVGRCDGGYCQMRITELIGSELGLKETEIRYKAKESFMFTGRLRDEIKEG
ncbi:MAG: NAD(P)/FAD-dependent oxidoreductase [Youngiibacter sp.]|nr:NAD(P)/FAD-dependent oxidoreductase [Youngiibacter sp.]